MEEEDTNINTVEPPLQDLNFDNVLEAAHEEKSHNIKINDEDMEELALLKPDDEDNEEVLNLDHMGVEDKDYQAKTQLSKMKVLEAGKIDPNDLDEFADYSN